MFGLLIEILDARQQETVLAIFDHFKHQGSIWTKTWYWADVSTVCKTLIVPLSKVHNMLMTQISMTFICYMIYRQNIVLKGLIFQQVRIFGTSTPGKKGFIFAWKSSIKRSVLRMQPKFTPRMCPPCLSQKLKIELKQTQFLHGLHLNPKWLKMMVEKRGI